MTEWITVNGARIDRAYLRDCVAEARTYTWKAARWSQRDDHGHCIVCSVTISGADVCFCSESGWLCTHCFENFVARSDAV
jgi:hypothetical protein